MSDCPHCYDGILLVSQQDQSTVSGYTVHHTLRRLPHAEQQSLIEQYGALEHVPVGWRLPPEYRVKRTGYACLCPAGRLKQKAGLITAGSVLSAEELIDLWPDGAPTGLPPTVEAMRRAGVPEACTQWSLTSYAQKFGSGKEAKRYLQYASMWLEEPNDKRTDLLMIGPNGTGKTGMAIALLRGAIEAGNTVRFWSVKELSIQWRNTYRGEDGESEVDMLQHCLAPDVMVFDDVTATKLTDFVEDTITMVVDMRQKQLKPTIMTLNVSNDEMNDIGTQLATLLGPTMFDRLRERAQLWPMAGASKRSPLAMKAK